MQHEFFPGLKLWSSNSNLIEEAEKLVISGLFSYIELNPIPGTSIEPFLEKDVPFIIHATTERYSVNIANPELREYNIACISRSLDWADQLGAQYVILHPGFGHIEDAIHFLSYIDDPRVVIENMPKVGINGEQMIGYSPEQINELKGEKFGFCFDLNHAIKAAISEKIDYRANILRFFGMNPDMFHLADGRISHETDEHLGFGEGDYDVRFLLRSIVESVPFEKRYITFETPRKGSSLSDDIKNIRYIEDLI
ncbi:TIM barrel protein [Methanocalculus sp.]|uniref:TIM barrel protein n=1 Tax=Methanocalculus sp. TaxID=2004547 RepID=UPI0026120FF3|nr:TIM barrel protein [Methanocalculus sp.]MDG6249244.1 TIM barrel protein [Methanocalculus sp.]